MTIETLFVLLLVAGVLALLGAIFIPPYLREARRPKALRRQGTALRRPVASLLERLRPGDDVLIVDKPSRGKRGARPTTFRGWSKDGRCLLETQAGETFRRDPADVLASFRGRGVVAEWKRRLAGDADGVR